MLLPVVVHFIMVCRFFEEGIVSSVDVGVVIVDARVLSPSGDSWTRTRLLLNLGMLLFKSVVDFCKLDNGRVGDCGAEIQAWQQ